MGNRQSPINVVTAKNVKGGTTYFKMYSPLRKATPLKFHNNGHSVQLEIASRGIKFASSSFGYLMQAIQIHFHTESEHTIDGVQFPLEMHVVCMPEDRDELGARPPLVVLGFMFKAGAANNMLKPLTDVVSQISAKGNSVNVTTVPRFDIPPMFYEYEGSLTTPPCYEDVHWMLSSEPMTASAAQIAAMKNAMFQINYRPVQPLNQRRVTQHDVTIDVFPPQAVAQAVDSAAAKGSTVSLDFAGLLQGSNCAK
eukprot:NODE_2368_length_935_cov_504.943567_g1948_i0.p1 GENE.NODE_2368_length_935_cov_504.943567_g1948_i0~~NODE_2368_length_935_cov_504.943567_g1948_i0.p1  ORF type:complete len:269 (+),score=63.19 NODE_2368_length_935_cov_504.943567_g1948_i0:51-809(+)